MKLKTIDRTQATRNSTTFSGEVYIQNVVGPEEGQEIDIVAVYFSAGARTKPHTHAQDQVLYIREGQGIVATETEKRMVNADDVILIPAGTWHWHGATLNSPMCHLSVMKRGTSDWEVDMKNWAAGYDEAE
jgi:quercetin dioxygenase-like cupin family protein